MLNALQDWIFNLLGVTSPLARELFWPYRSLVPNEVATAIMLLAILAFMALTVYIWRGYAVSVGEAKRGNFVAAVLATVIALMLGVGMPWCAAYNANLTATRLRAMLADSTVQVSFSEDMLGTRRVTLETVVAPQVKHTETLFGRTVVDSTRVHYNTITFSLPVARRASEILGASTSRADREASTRLAALASPHR